MVAYQTLNIARINMYANSAGAVIAHFSGTYINHKSW